MARIWSQSIARRTLLGEESMNPTIAGKFALGQPRSVRRAIHRAGKHRRRFHRGNPVPALAGALAGLAQTGIGKAVLGKLGIRAGSARYEGGPLVSTVAAFLELVKSGDLTTVRKLHHLATSPAEKGRVAWAMVWNRELPALEGALPLEVQQEIARLDPTSIFAARIKEAGVARGSAAARRATQAEARAERERAAAERREERLTGLGGVAAQALLGRGRSLRRPRRKRRRAAPRGFSF